MTDDRDREMEGEREVNYSTEMGGGASGTGQTDNLNPGAHVRDVLDRTTDEPGSFHEGERPHDDETLT